MRIFSSRKTLPSAPQMHGLWLADLRRQSAAVTGGELVADLSNVDKISSSELGELAKIHLSLREHDQRLVLENVHEFVFEVLELTRMNRLVEVRSCRAVAHS